MERKYACIASLPEREGMLEKTVESLKNQVDQVFVTLNGYDHVPDFVLDGGFVVLDNSMGDAGKFYFAEQLKGYILTCDDDLIYPPDYVNYMIEGTKKYPGSAITLHGRDYPRPVVNFGLLQNGYPCLGDVMTDVQVDVGGDGVMCWHTDTLKVRFEDFKQKNMSQLYFSKLCHEQNVPIVVLKHLKGYLGYMNPAWTIWDESYKEKFVKQTELLKSFLV